MSNDKRIGEVIYTNYEYGSGISTVTTNSAPGSTVARAPDNRELFPIQIVIRDMSGASQEVQFYDYDTVDSEGDDSNVCYPDLNLDANETYIIDREMIEGLCLRYGLAITPEDGTDGVDVFVKYKIEGGGKARE